MRQILRLFFSILLLCGINVDVNASDLAPDISAGQRRAAVCFACHNTDGISKIPGIPHLAGQNRIYLEKSLHAYRAAILRQDPSMNAMAKPLSDRDIENIAAYFSLQTRMSSGQTAAAELEVLRRLERPQVCTKTVAQPNAAATAVVAKTPESQAVAEPKVAVNAEAVAPAGRSGAKVYEASCVNCHGSGAAGAPKLGDKAAWESRIAQGTEVLLQHAVQGFKTMPPKGICMDCTDAELKAAVEFFIESAK